MILKLLEKIEKFLSDRVPVVCFTCHTTRAKKNMKYERTNMNQLVPLCPKCHTSIFAPFSVKDGHHG